MSDIKKKRGGYRSGAGRPPVENKLPRKKHSFMFTSLEWRSISIGARESNTSRRAYLSELVRKDLALIYKAQQGGFGNESNI